MIIITLFIPLLLIHIPEYNITPDQNRFCVKDINVQCCYNYVFIATAIKKITKIGLI